MSLRALPGNLILKIVKEPKKDKTGSGIMLPDSFINGEKNEVLSSEVFFSGIQGINVGDKVRYMKNAEVTFVEDGVPYCYLNERDVVAFIKKPGTYFEPLKIESMETI